MPEYHRMQVSPSLVAKKNSRQIRMKAMRQERNRGRKGTVEITVSDATKIVGAEVISSILEYTKAPRQSSAFSRQADRIQISGVELRSPMPPVEGRTRLPKAPKKPRLSKDAALLLARLEREFSDPLVDFRGVDPDRIVQAVMRLVPHKGRNELAERVGPFYDTAGLMSWLGISRQAINKKVHAGKLIACRTEDRVLLYPTWQFGEDGELSPGISNVLGILWAGTQDGWTIALWLLTEADQFEGESAVEWLSKGKDADVVLEVARRDAAVWAA